MKKSEIDIRPKIKSELISLRDLYNGTTIEKVKNSHMYFKIAFPLEEDFLCFKSKEILDSFYKHNKEKITMYYKDSPYISNDVII